jgi:hypothetical protein
MIDVKLFVVVTLALIFGVFGIYFFGQGFLRLIRSNPELGWLAVPGQIVESRVDQGYRGVRSACIRYTYQHQGVTYESRRIAPLEFWSNASTADKFVEKYPSGQNLMVYLNQSDPKKTVLEPKNQPIAAVASMLFGIALGLTTVIAYFMLAMSNI